MRRMLVPGSGWIVLAALAIPMIASSAKPLVKKLGKGLRDLGDKLVEVSEEKTAPPPAATSAETPVEKPSKPRATRKKTETGPPKPKTRSTRPKKSLG